MRAAPPGTGSPEAPRAREKAIYAGGHGEVAIPVPIPNTEVKHLCADDTAESGKVGSCRLFYFKCFSFFQSIKIFQFNIYCYFAVLKFYEILFRQFYLLEIGLQYSLQFLNHKMKVCLNRLQGG